MTMNVIKLINLVIIDCIGRRMKLWEACTCLGPTNPALHFSYYLVVNIFCLSNCNQPQETNLLSINTTNKLKYETELSLGCQRQPAASKNHSEQKILRKLQLYYLDYDKNVLENK